jgi:hypothetical protein
VSDCCSNSIRVIKTAKQTYTIPITYREVVSVSAINSCTVVCDTCTVDHLAEGLTQLKPRK